MTRLVPISEKDNRRQGSENGLPRNMQNYLNQSQVNTLRQLELLGWRLFFIRRENCVPPLVVLRHQDSGKFSVIEERGLANMSPEIAMRAARH